MSVTITTAGGPDINLSNDNFAHLWGMMGLDRQDWIGTTWGRTLLAAVERGERALEGPQAGDMGRSTVRTGGEDRPGPLTINFGLDEHGLRIRLARLREIAEHAIRTEETVTWA